MQNTPDYLFHYTNIETLSLILANRTFRLTSLNQLDDLQEKETGDTPNFGQFCYVSSWTDDETESIPMWNMYSSLESGIRIKLKANPFKLYKNSPNYISKIKLLSIIDSSTEAFQHSYIPLRCMLEQHFSCLHAMTPSFLHQVKYTNDQGKLYPNLILKHDNQILMMPDQLGLYKNEYWSFQKEWRYKLMCFPIGPDNSMEQLNIMASLMVNGIVKQPFSYYDLKLDDDAFSHMEITLSPKISPGYRLIVNSLIEKYNPTAQIYDSSLIGLV